MSQTGYTPISLYYTTTASAVPTAGNLVNGELALNISTSDGKLFYKDSAGVVQVLATKASASGSFTSITDSGNLTFTGTGNRILGDFSNGTQSNRVAFQTSTTNGSTVINAITNGTGTTSAIRTFNTSTADLGAYAGIRADGSAIYFESAINGAASYLPLTMYTGGSERLRIDTSGNVGIGTSTITSGIKLQITGNSLIPLTNSYHCYTFDYGMGTPDSAGLQIFAGSGDSIRFGNRTSGTFTERMRIEPAAGVVLVGTTNASYAANGIRFNPAEDGGNINIGHASGRPSGSVYMGFGYNGTGIGSISQSGTTGVLYNIVSDRRLKENIVDAPSALSLINSVKVRSFDFKSDGSHTKFGLIAQEFYEVAPECVSKGDDGEEITKTWGLDSSGLVPALIKAIQELKSEIDLLKGK